MTLYPGGCFHAWLKDRTPWVCKRCGQRWFPRQGWERDRAVSAKNSTPRG